MDFGGVGTDSQNQSPYLSQVRPLIFDFNIASTDNQYTALHFACAIPTLIMITDIAHIDSVTAFCLSSHLRTPSFLVPHEFLSSKKIIRKYERIDLHQYWTNKAKGKTPMRFRGIGGEELEEIGIEGQE